MTFWANDVWANDGWANDGWANDVWKNVVAPINCMCLTIVDNAMKIA